MTLQLEFTIEEEARLVRAARIQGLALPEFARLQLLELAAQAETIEALREGLEDVANGRVRPVHEALEEFRQKHGIAR